MEKFSTKVLNMSEPSEELSSAAAQNGASTDNPAAEVPTSQALVGDAPSAAEPPVGNALVPEAPTAASVAEAPKAPRPVKRSWDQLGT